MCGAVIIRIEHICLHPNALIEPGAIQRAEFHRECNELQVADAVPVTRHAARSAVGERRSDRGTRERAARRRLLAPQGRYP